MLRSLYGDATCCYNPATQVKLLNRARQLVLVVRCVDGMQDD